MPDEINALQVGIPLLNAEHVEGQLPVAVGLLLCEELLVRFVVVNHEVARCDFFETVDFSGHRGAARQIDGYGGFQVDGDALGKRLVVVPVLFEPCLPTRPVVRYGEIGFAKTNPVRPLRLPERLVLGGEFVPGGDAAVLRQAVQPFECVVNARAQEQFDGGLKGGLDAVDVLQLVLVRTPFVAG